jgi:hypothetical protein
LISGSDKTSPVPCLLISAGRRGRLRHGGLLFELFGSELFDVLVDGLLPSIEIFA